MTAFVLDNSVTMRWCFDAGQHAYADGVPSQLDAIDGQAFVPVLWRYEVAAVLARAQRAGAISARDAAGFIADPEGQEIIVDMPGIEHVMGAVHELATRYGRTGYDALYLELALRRNLPLATLDKDLLRACQAAGGTVR